MQQPHFVQVTSSGQSFKLGLENIPESLLKTISVHDSTGISVGLITNQTGKDQAGRPNVDVLASKGISIKNIFTTHSLRMVNKKDGVIPVYPLEILTASPQSSEKLINEIDAFIFDIQDSGIRHHGYLTMLLQTMKIAGNFNKTFIVLDRPNLLGNAMEGALINEKSSEGEALPIPVRHGMTIGELAHYFNRYILDNAVKLCVVPMENYSRTSDRSRLLCRLSSNINTIDSCYGYSFLGLLGEVSPFDIGVDTDKAFQCILLPETLHFPKEKWVCLKKMLKDQGIESKDYRYFSKRKKFECKGLQLFIKDINSFSSFNTLLTVLKFFKDSGLELQFSKHFDVVLGTTKVRSLIEGVISHQELASVVNKELQ